MDFWALCRALNGVGGTIVILTQLVIYMTAKFFLVIYDGVRGRGVRSDRRARRTDEGKQVGRIAMCERCQRLIEKGAATRRAGGLTAACRVRD